MKKSEVIRRYGIATYERNLKYMREWGTHNKARIKEHSQKACRKGGPLYEKKLAWNRTGLRAQRSSIRSNHRRKWQPYKRIIAPGSQCHHQWIDGTAEYTGLALVEADQHMHGFIDVIKILEGEITLFTEKEIREQKGEFRK